MDVRDELHAYLGGIIGNHGGILICAGSVADHVHLLLAHPRTCAPSELVQEIKTGSSKWMKTKAERYARFHWQRGYGVFSVSPSHRCLGGLYPEPGGAPSASDFPGRIPASLEEVRHPI